MDLLLNQRLLPGLIPLDETNSDNAICYQNPTVLCRTLQEGVRENVATWYISPERMLVETIVMAMVFLAFLRVAFSGASGEGKGISLRLPAPVFFVTIVLYGLQIRFKLMGYRLKFLFLLMPCNLLQLLAVLLGLPDGIVSRKVKFAIVNLLYSFQVLVWIVFIESDTRDLKESFEVEYFWVYHFVLLFLPLFYLFTGRVVVGRKGFFKWWLASVSSFGLVYTFFVTIISIYTGMNINYMLSPPLAFAEIGDNYRVLSVAAIGLLFAVSRLACALVSMLIPGISDRGLEKEKEKKKKKKK